MIARARLLTLGLIVVTAALTCVAAVDRRTELGTLAATLVPATNVTFDVTAAPAGSGVRRGDRLEIRDPRVLATIAYHTLRAGSTISAVRIAPGPRTAVRLAVRRDTPGPLGLVFLAIVLAALAVGFLIALRGSAAGSLSLAAFFGFVGLLLNPTGPWMPPPFVLAYVTISNLPGLVAFLFAIDFATRFTGEGEAPVQRRIRRIAWTLGGVLGVASVAITGASFVTDTLPTALQFVVIATLAAAVLGFLASLAFSFSRVADAERQRALWVVASLGVGAFGLLVTVVEIATGVSEPTRDYPLLLLVAMPLGCAYAILRYRLLDIAFVVNRAAVFGVTSLVVIAALALVDYGIGQVLGSYLTRTGLVVQLALALGIGVATRPLHARVDAVVDDLFFRERHATERALRTFARDVAFVDDAALALERTVATVAHAARMRCVAFVAWEPDASDGDRGAFACAAAACGAPGSARAPVDRLDRNDGAIVRLRATRTYVDTRDVATDLDAEFVFPMFARNRLVGILACGERGDGATAYAPDELEAIAAVALAAGLALDLARIEALERENAALRAVGHGVAQAIA